jgi:hypothetical protein
MFTLKRHFRKLITVLPLLEDGCMPRLVAVPDDRRRESFLRPCFLLSLCCLPVSDLEGPLITKIIQRL